VIDLSQLADPPWTLDVVNSLVDKSFVRPLADERFDLLVSVQAYASEHLVTEGRYAGSGPAALVAAHARHGAWFAALGPQRAIENACVELDNLAAACRRAVHSGDAERAAGALVGAWAALNLHGPFKAGVDLAEAVCAMPGLAARDAAHARAVFGHALEAAGKRVQAKPHFEAALVAAHQAGDAACEAAVTVRLAAGQARAGQADAARGLLAQALALAQRAGNSALQCAAINALGTVEFEQGRMAEAQVHYEAALALARQDGDRRWQGMLLGNLANTHALLGRMAQAQAGCEEALQIARLLADRQREGDHLCNLGMLQYLQDHYADAQVAAEQALQVAREMGAARLECSAVGNLGLAQAAVGRLVDACSNYRAALALARAGSLGLVEAYFLGHLAVALARQADHVAASLALEDCAAIVAPRGDPQSLALLDCARAECAWRRGDAEAAYAARAQAYDLVRPDSAQSLSELGRAFATVDALLGPLPQQEVTRSV
jgi:tetratricopeptide (TPR) repeat protein